MKSSEECGAAFFERVRAEECNVDPGWLEFISAIRKGLPAAGRIRNTTVFALRTVKWFAVLSVRHSSSENSEKTMPINRRETSPVRRIFPILVPVDAILQPTSCFILISSPIQYCQK
jgi:hypothetical protein